MARPRKDTATDEAPEMDAKPWRRVKITAYKVHTSHGRFIEGDYANLPGDIADQLIADGKAK
jgi:hypothetical protein